MDNLLPFGGLSPHKIRVCCPKSFEDAEEAINAIKADDMLLVNLAALESKLAQRLTDYIAGSTFALSGERMEIGKGVFLFAPPTFSIRKIVASACCEFRIFRALASFW
ncbi:cell division protein SepF [Acaryochloris sp. CCMEE 5410]|uniref:cell division protein SepF n=1 Tax=Acaryochloris sp. CCMEE 5410 TaxID=310037 RepID=UPI001F2F8D1E|nr:cell division protein SepF [Acaryochloris sp. CCMEE 5410]